VSLAQAQTGKIIGKVFDSGDSSVVEGASVLITGTKLYAITDLNGEFIINHIPPGSYKVEMLFMSYSTYKIEDVKVQSDQTTTVNGFLAKSVTDLAKQTIKSGRRVMNTLNSMYLKQKEVGSIGDVISAEIANISPVKTTGDLLKKVSGAAIQDNRFVIIRGLSDRYNYALINGSILASSEADRKAFSFDIFPSSMIDNIIISKTATPDLPGEFAGGVVQLTTKDIPLVNTLNVKFGLSYNTITTFKSFFDYKGGKTDFLGMDNGVRSVPKGIPSSEDYIRLSKADQLKESEKFSGDFSTRSKTALPSGNLVLTYGKVKKMTKNRQLGSMAALYYSYSQANSDAEVRDFDQSGFIYEYRDKQYNENIQLSGLWNVGFKWGLNNRISLKNTYNILSNDQTTLREGYDRQADRDKRMTALYFQQSKMLASQLIGEHVFNKNKTGKDQKLEWVIGYNNILRDIPDFRRLTYAKNPDNDISKYEAYITTNASPYDGGRFYSTMKEHSYNASISYLVPEFINKRFKTDLKFGGLAQQRQRDFSARVLGYVINSTAQFQDSLRRLGEDKIFAPENLNSKGFRVSESTNMSDQYEAFSALQAGFMMFDTKLGKKVRFVYGLRTENFFQELKSFNNDRTALRAVNANLDFLPSINFTYSPLLNTNFRLAFSKTLSRPEFRELAPFSFFDFNKFIEVSGNSKLIRTEIYNYDFKYELFPEKGEILSFSAFYKRFVAPIEQVLNPDIGGGTFSVTYTNAKSATNFGCELEFRFKLDRIATNKIVKNITVYGNGALIISRVNVSNIAGVSDRPLQGQSPYILNAGLSYTNEKDNLSVSANVNRVGRRIFFVGVDTYPDFYEKPRTVLDFQINKKIKKNSEVRFSISDILHQDLIFYQNKISDGETVFSASADNVNRLYKVGAVYSFSYSYKF
jgi:hypothetical protein